jgi:hypothetical protein
MRTLGMPDHLGWNAGQKKGPPENRGPISVKVKNLQRGTAGAANWENAICINRTYYDAFSSRRTHFLCNAAMLARQSSLRFLQEDSLCNPRAASHRDKEKALDPFGERLFRPGTLSREKDRIRPLVNRSTALLMTSAAGLIAMPQACRLNLNEPTGNETPSKTPSARSGPPSP